MPTVENVINSFLKETLQQPLVSNPPYVGDQLEEKKKKQEDNKINKQAKKIYFFETSTHFLDRMEERNITEEKIKEIIREGESKFQNVFKGTMEFVKDNLKVVIDIIKKKLITVMHVHDKEASMYEMVSDIENFICANYSQNADRVQKMQETQGTLKKKFKNFMDIPNKENAKELITVMDSYKRIVEKVPFGPRIEDYKIKFELN